MSKNPVKEAHGRGTWALELLRPGLGAGSPLLSQETWGRSPHLSDPQPPLLPSGRM